MPATQKTSDEPWTIRRVLGWTRDKFAAIGIPSARLDAELLLAHSLGKPRVALYTAYEQPLTDEELAGYRGLIQRRLGGEPIAYLVGEREFYSLPLRVTKDVLIPRPETEGLVDTVLRRLGQRERPGDRAELQVQYESPPEELSPSQGAGGTAEHAAPVAGVELSYEPLASDPAEEAAEAAPAASAAPFVRGVKKAPPPPPPGDGEGDAAGPLIVDVGTGSGAVALALKHTRPRARVIAIDLSEAALVIARGNAERLGLDVEFLHGDLLTPLPAELRCDAIAANLPYIPTDEISKLMPEVRCEPRGALNGGQDGLALIRLLIKQAPAHLVPGAALSLEIGDGQASAVAALLRAGGFADVTIENDLAGLPRIVSGRLASGQPASGGISSGPGRAR